jgi:pyridoxamine 5'-phosphate oxidase
VAGTPRTSVAYALLRVVPDAERGELINAGIVVHCAERRFLQARVALDEGRLDALAPGTDPEPIRTRLEHLVRLAAGDAGAGPAARLEPAERFQRIVAPAGGVVQAGPVRTAACEDPARALDELFASLVAPPRFGGMRRAYDGPALDEASLAPTWLEQFERWFAEARGLRERNAMVLATASADGAPSARSVLLKAVDQHGFVFFTNLRSRKGQDLAANPRAALVFPWVTLQRQVIVTGRAELLPDADNDAYFASRPLGSQLSAAVSPQSAVIASRAELEAARERLAAGGGAVPRPPHWGGVRVVPDAVEFWQGRPERLHDRLRFRRDGGRWTVERLAP